MLEARVTYKNGRTHTVEANTIEMLKTKCQPLIDNPEVVDIWVCKIEGIGWLKSIFALNIL